MKREIIITSDGSTTIHIPQWNEQYHSKHGAIQEAKHVFIQKGLNHVKADKISILEIGFGTGLNCFITFLETQKQTHYTGIEAFPISVNEISKLNYVTELNAKKHEDVFKTIHDVSWEREHQITSNFKLLKRKQLIENINDKACFNLIYFDAFGARVQPELWSESIFKKMYDALQPDGVLVTYAAKGSVRRAMLSVGFSVERLDGPPGKREMLRATKTITNGI